MQSDLTLERRSNVNACVAVLVRSNILVMCSENLRCLSNCTPSILDDLSSVTAELPRIMLGMVNSFWSVNVSEHDLSILRDRSFCWQKSSVRTASSCNGLRRNSVIVALCDVDSEMRTSFFVMAEKIVMSSAYFKCWLAGCNAWMNAFHKRGIKQCLVVHLWWYFYN